MAGETNRTGLPSVSTSVSPVPNSGEVYRAHLQLVARWAGRLAGPGLDVEDLVQEVFLQVHRLLPQFRGEAQLTTWLYSITHNVVRTRRRKERFRRLFWFAGDPERLHVVATGPTPLEAVERQQSTELIYRALDGMPEKYRAIFILFEIDGRSGEEIAELTGTKLSTVWVQLSRARALLLKRFEKLERGRAR
jgi:RNA polymerase sigma-70 factor, ECF subfamily